MVRRRVKVGHDRHGQYIRYRGQKIYLSQAIVKKGVKSGMDNFDLVKWILKQLVLRRRARRRARERRDLRSQKEYSNVVESKGSTGPKLPPSMTHIPTMLYERQRLLDRAKEQKMLADAKATESEPDRRELKRLTHLVDSGQIKQEGGKWVNTKSGRRLYLEPEIVEYLSEYKNASDSAVGDAEADAIAAKREQLQTELREKLQKQKTLQQEYKDIIDAADDTKSIEKIGDRDNLRAQLKDLGVTTGKGYPSKETVINALKARIEEIKRHPEREEVIDKKKGTTKKLKEYIPIMKELRFYQAYVGFKKSLEDMEQDIMKKK